MNEHGKQQQFLAAVVPGGLQSQSDARPVVFVDGDGGDGNLRALTVGFLPDQPFGAQVDDPADFGLVSFSQDDLIVKRDAAHDKPQRGHAKNQA